MQKITACVAGLLALSMFTGCGADRAPGTAARPRKVASDDTGVTPPKGEFSTPHTGHPHGVGGTSPAASAGGSSSSAAAPKHLPWRTETAANPRAADQPEAAGSSPAQSAGADGPPALVVRPEKPYKTVTVFFGTDREPAAAANGPLALFRSLRWTGLAALLALAATAAAWRLSPPRWSRGVLIAGGVATGLVLAYCGYQGMAAWQKAEDSGAFYGFYGNQRGNVSVGTCDVSIPPAHQVGELEAPSILRLEVRENPLRHVVLLDTAPLDEDEFYSRLRQRVVASPRRDVFVFVHGYNVNFENAARRTAQMAHDLKFEGAPVFWSWPSQAGLFKYTIDETNVEWTIPHLKQFLLDVARKSGAQSVTLIAHSMGNRALTGALRAIAAELHGETMFQQVVLTAPDIDAEIFKRDIAPAVVKTARHVTLYASSNDEALAASKKIHGAPRAGDSGEGLVIVPGVETIDVSAVDSSLLGHSYYGENATVLADLYHLLREGKPADQRPWLERMLRGGAAYWVLRPQVALRAGGKPR